jgi:hypothetical protein
MKWIDKAKKNKEKNSSPICFEQNKANFKISNEGNNGDPPFFKERGEIDFDFKTPESLYIKKTEDKGFGVFSEKTIEQNEVIEVCYCISLKWGARYHGDPSIAEYAHWSQACECYDCKKNGPRGFIGLGYGSVYNCSSNIEEANANFKIDHLNKSITFYSTKKINANEEILIWLGDSYYNYWCNRKYEN